MRVIPSSSFFLSSSSVGKQSQLLLQPTEVELGLHDGMEFDKRRCLNTVYLGPCLENRKFQFCHAAAKKCYGSGNYSICIEGLSPA